MSIGLTHIEARLYVAQTLTSAIPIEVITRDNPGALSCTGTQPTANSFVVFDITEGMPELDGRIIRAMNVDALAHSFDLDGVDTTGYTPFAAGSAREVTAWALLGEATDTLNFDNPKPQKIDRTRLSDHQERSIPGRAPARSVSVDVLFAAGGTDALALVNAAAAARANLAFKLVLKSGEILVWNGVPYVGPPQLSTNKAMTRQIEVSLAGMEMDYAS